MDLILAHKRTMQLGEKLGLTVATRTTLATAVSEVVRTVIDFTDNGRLSLTISGTFPRYAVHAIIGFVSEHQFRETDEGLYYAKRLLPDFTFRAIGSDYSVSMGLSLPRSLKLNMSGIVSLQTYFKNLEPINSYEEIKNRNSQLNQLTIDQEKEIQIVRELDEKKNEFISVASHELKTPITVIKAYTQMLKQLKDEYSEKVGKVIEKLEVQTGKLARLSYQLMDVSKLENGSLQYDLVKIEFSQFLNETIDMLSSVHAGNIINLELGCDCQVMADPLRLEQVLTNLIGNASKYSDRGSQIHVKTYIAEAEPAVVVKISDSGIGMSDEGVARIFEKFYRLEDVVSSHPGLGMGLYISSKIIADHGGRIWVDSVKGSGSTFSFTLPLPSILNS